MFEEQILKQAQKLLSVNYAPSKLLIVFYRPPDTDLKYIKEFKKSLKLVSKANFERIIVLGDFNLPNIDWSTGMEITGEVIGNPFAKTVKAG